MASGSVYYMERRSRFGRRFWQIELKKNITIVRCGKTDLSDRGRLFPSRRHGSFPVALKFVQRNVKKKRGLGYILKRGKTAPKFKPKEKREKKRKQIKQKRQKTKQKKTAARLGRANQVNRTTAVKKKKGTVVPPRLQKQKTLPAVELEEQRKSTPHTQPSLVKQTSLTVGKGKAYIPPQNKWPIQMDMPVAWRFPFENLHSCAFGIYVDENHALFGHDDGRVVELDPNGQVIRVYKLPNGVKCITQDGEFLYVGCDDGGLYDVTHGEPRKMCMIEGFGQVYWLDVLRGMLSASGGSGNVALANYEGEVIWQKKSPGSNGWMVRMDEEGIYHGYASGVTRYAAQNGKMVWQHNCAGVVYFGVQEKDYVHIAEGCLARKIDKKSGKVIQTYAGNVSSAYCNEIGDGLVFIGDSRNIRCCDEKSGKLVYSFTYPSGMDGEGGRNILSMQYHQGRLYCVGQGEFKVLDLSQAAIKAVQNKQQINVVELHMDEAAPVVAPITSVDLVTSVEANRGGVIVQCVKEKGKLRIKPLSDGYNKNWNCQFPKAIRKEGAKYVVEELREAKYFSGKYYRSFGYIKEIKD